MVEKSKTNSKAKMAIPLLIVFTVLGIGVYFYFEGMVSSNVTFAYNQDNEIFSGEVTFQIFGLKQPTDVEVIVINPNDTINYLSVEKQGENYVSEKYETIIEKQYLQEKSPEFLISYRLNGRKNVEYVYRGEDRLYIPDK